MAQKRQELYSGGPIVVDGAAVSSEQVAAVARARAPITVGKTGRARLAKSHAALHAAIAEGQVLYGVNTGFGSLAQKRVSGEQLKEIQRNLILSHAAGVGEPLPEEVVRGMLFLLVASLTRGMSGVRPQLVDHLIALLNSGMTPVVPSVGSVGASGDLAPLAHAALVLIGCGEVCCGGERLGGAEALSRIGVPALELEAKEGLALINGTHLMAASAALSLADIERVFSAALVGAAMSIDACRGTDEFLDERIHQARGQDGQSEVARRLSALIAGSEIVPSHLHDDPRVQDPYSLRCAPQVLGACLDCFRFARSIVERELGAVTDNPLVFCEATPPLRRVVSAGNFHGMPLALALDTLCMALCHVAGIAERRIYYMLAASDSENRLNPHLSPVPGTHSGLMLAQYTAAACCNELVGLTLPASVSNFPTSAGMEDYNSFGPYAAYKVRRAVERLSQVVAIELLCAAEALEYQRPLRSGAGVEEAHAKVREVVSRRTEDRPLAPDIQVLEQLVLRGHFSEQPASE